MSTTSETLSPDALRLCHILKWESFDGYGFNLRAEKGKPGQFIGKVDEGSPAEAAGLREGDRIVEVNDVNIANENHKQVVQRIKALPNETKLLVVDADGESYFKAQNIVIKGSLPCVKTCKTPPESEKPISDAPKTPSEDNVSQKSVKSSESADYENSNHASIISSETEKANDNSTMDMKNDNSSLNLKMTAAELRAQLAAKKKYDPKKDSSINFKKKYDIVQKL
uniref:Na(+)/H(+) exchange regulatory cofactor NHE-RF2 n=1 Tax=Lygus hesperus TaxID=30085 RepID=A0A0A9X6F1_LYGHE